MFVIFLSPKKIVYLFILVPISVTLDPDRLRVNVGDDVSIFCRIDGFPIRNIRWIRNGRLILTQNISEHESESGSKRDEMRKKRGECLC